MACRHACLFLLLLPVLYACSEPPSDEKLIASAMEQLQQATEQKKLRAVMQFYTDDFLGNGRMNKASLQARIYFHFRQNPRVTAYISNVDIQLDENLARVSCQLLVTGSQGVLPDKGRLYHIESSWRKEQSVWRVFRSEWEDIIQELAR